MLPDDGYVGLQLVDLGIGFSQFSQQL